MALITPVPDPKTAEEKYQTVIRKNTFYFYNPEFENQYESYINSIREALSLLKAQLEKTVNIQDQKNIFETFLANKSIGLTALLALTGFSNESLKRLITLIRVVDDQELVTLSLKSEWCPIPKDQDNIEEWSDDFIEKLLTENTSFRKGLVNLFFEGSTVQFLVKTMKTFELKKLSFSKMRFDIEAMLDTLVRYKEKGSYSAKKGNNAETLIKNLLELKSITWATGDLKELVDNAPIQKRTMDFIIPNKKNPKIIIESSYLMTTSSGQGDKSKTEVAVSELLKEHYPNAIFVGFVDGIGWYVRKNDLKRMVEAYSDVFTFHSDEIDRFQRFLDKAIGPSTVQGKIPGI